MGIQVALNHRTQYHYEKEIYLGPQLVQLRPAPHSRAKILSYSLDVSPAEHLLNWQMDLHYNHVARLIFQGKTDKLVVEVSLVADLSPVNPFNFLLEPGAEEYPFDYASDLTKDLEPYLSVDPAGLRFIEFLAEFAGTKSGTVTFLLNVNRRVRDTVSYVARLEPGVQTCEETLQIGSGSCRDSAWLLVQTLRRLGIAARFVSGYLIQLAPDEPSFEGSSGPTEDSADLHAWAEAYLPGAGWIGLDPTAGLLAGEGHIPLVCTPTAAQAAPIAGTAEPTQVDFDYSMTVRRLNEAPGVSRPFSETDWAKIERLAHQVDTDLEAQDVRLTMGGEPTFVGIDEPESPQWNIEALGPIKRTRGLDLIRAIRDRIAAGALLHFGQGKWYPGEPLPRWAFSCYWRGDGVPVWENPNLILREDEPSSYDVADALIFSEALTRRLQVSQENLLPAYSAADETAETAGYILPIRRRQHEGKLTWSSQLWFPRPERLELMPGDGPIGFRIPSDVIPWVAPDELAYELDVAPFADKAKLPDGPGRYPELFAVEPQPDPLPPLSSTAETAPVLIRTALCVQVREGRLYVFLPFASELADYLDMVAAVEDTCVHMGMKIWVEGYTPPADSRLRFFSVTPDPGVLEINLPPASDWDELAALHRVLFEEASKNRLTAEKFRYDGSHAATGGGSHIVIGGATVAESPFLRRPDLLRSMVSFWQNHPSLSYLFAGMYVGPTSQYPRVDEARTDALYELEIAFANLPKDDCPAWIVDGLFRNLLADMTGNSHRAEFCIDKMFPPEGFGLQLGLVELRAFEMAPHLRMSLLQSLLVRALIAVFWKSPFEGGLTRWGTALHDRFMLPHFVKRDLSQVLGTLRRGGFQFEDEWFTAHMEFRFPKIGSITADGLELELRQALEPWNVLAEETISGRTARSVDSSLERIQVRLSGIEANSRYVVTCNGRRVPLTPTGEPGVALAGVRFRARRFAASLHPTVPIHAPLAFELIDTLRGCSAGQCTYFVVSPDGRVYDSLPANAADAETRRKERFRIDSTPVGPVVAPEDELNPVFPITLDMRMPQTGRSGPAAEAEHEP